MDAVYNEQLIKILTNKDSYAWIFLNNISLRRFVFPFPLVFVIFMVTK